MKIEELSNEAQAGLRQWAYEVLDDEMMLDAISGNSEAWAWVCFQLRASEDRPEWFPKGKSATIQVIEEKVSHEAKFSLPAGCRR